MTSPLLDPDNPREAFRTVLAMLDGHKLAHMKLQAKVHSLSIAVNALTALLTRDNLIDREELEALMVKSGATFDQLRGDGVA